MAKYLLSDVRAMLRGIGKVAEKGLKLQTEELNQRFSNSSLRPSTASSIFSNASQKTPHSQPFNVQEMAARAGAVFQGIQEQVKIVAGYNSPTTNLVLDNGFTLYSNKVGANTATKRHPTTADAPDSSGHEHPDGESGEAAKRLEKFMNPPVAPLDIGEKGVSSQEAASGEALEATEMKEETTHKNDKFRKDSTKTFIDSGGDSSIKAEDLKKISKVPPGVPVKADSSF